MTQLTTRSSIAGHSEMHRCRNHTVTAVAAPTTSLEGAADCWQQYLSLRSPHTPKTTSGLKVGPQHEQRIASCSQGKTTEAIAQPFLNKNGRQASMHALGCQVVSYEALSAALQHPAISSDPKMVCSLLKTCKIWREALQQTSAANMSISLASNNLFNCAGFAGWLPKHAGLVGEMSFDYEYTPGLQPSREEIAAAEQLVALSLQLAAAAKAPLTLHTLKTRSPSLLLALQTAGLTGLTHLCLSETALRTTGMSMNSSSVASALGRLTQLRVLELNGFNAQVKGSWLAAIGQLSCLTDLQLERVDEACNLELLPRQLQQLTLVCLLNCRVALGHLSELRQLNLVVQGNPAPGSVLPVSLTSLTFSQWWEGTHTEHLVLSTLQQLQHLVLSNSVVQHQQLQAVSRLKNLCFINSSYDCISYASYAAPAWKYLSPLKHLVIYDDWNEQLNLEQSQALLQGVAAATSLTYLHFNCCALDSTSVRQYLRFQGLQQLRHLEVMYLEQLEPVDVLQLTALTSLTTLIVKDVADVIDDTVVTQLAGTLTGLQELQLLNVGECTSAVLPALATLTSLTCLALDEWYGEKVEVSLVQLSVLTGLSSLKCFYCDWFEDGVIEELWDFESRVWRTPPDHFLSLN